MCTIRVSIYHKSAFVDVLFQTNCLGIVYTGGPTSFNLKFCKTLVYSVLSSFDLNCIVQYFYFHPVWETCVGSLGLHENSRRFQFWFDTFLQPKVSELVFFCYNNNKKFLIIYHTMLPVFQRVDLHLYWDTFMLQRGHWSDIIVCRW